MDQGKSGTRLRNVKLAHAAAVEHASNAIPAPLEKLKGAAVDTLVTALGDMFSKVDDTLYQMADRAESNSEQNYYFDAFG